MNHIKRVCGSRTLLFCLITFFAFHCALAQKAISALEAKNHIGEQATVCGMVASTHFAYRSKGSPTFINLDEPYPNQVFTVMIWIEDRAKFGSPEKRYANQHVCVSGLIQSYRGTPEIILRNPTQIKVEKQN